MDSQYDLSRGANSQADVYSQDPSYSLSSSQSSSQSHPLSSHLNDDEITKNDAWPIITAYFDEKGLVRQQLDSFDEFIQNKMQEVIDEANAIEVIPESRVPEDHPDYQRRRYKFKFGQIYLSTPQMTEADGTTDTMRPNVARIRNLT